MPLPADLLAAAALPGVSNIRASEDDDLLYAASGRWRIGLTSLLLGAVDQRPFQDGIWTTPCAAPGSGSPFQNVQMDPPASKYPVHLECSAHGLI